MTLKNKENEAKLSSKEDLEKASNLITALGASFEELNAEEAKKMGINGGIKVTETGNGLLAQNTDIQEGFVITRLNNVNVKNIKEFESILNQSRGNGVLIEGRYPGKSGVKYYAFGF